MMSFGLILMAALLLMFIVGQTMAETKRPKQALSVGVILAIVYCVLSWQAFSTPGEAAFVMALWSSTICLPAFFGLLAGYAIGVYRRTEPDETTR